MKANFKPLGLAAAVAAASAGYTGAAYAQPQLSETGLGDLGLVPYYTVRDAMISGVIITNTSGYTQVVKLRLRRGTDSMDALDFNLIMSPYDQWTGFLSDDDNGTISFRTNDNTCTAPIRQSGIFEMPGLYREGADEGYIEVIAMGQADPTQPISRVAKHGPTGEPASCATVAENFFANAYLNALDGQPPNPTQSGVLSIGATSQPCVTAAIDPTCKADVPVPPGVYGQPGHAISSYMPSDNALKVSYFIRNDDTGTEFGNAAVMIENFLDSPSITDQEYGVFSGDLWGFDFPDLNGASPAGGQTGRFELLRNSGIIGGTAVINSWSANPNTNLGTDWVITAPGQYLMMELIEYLNQELLDNGECNVGPVDEQEYDYDDDDTPGSCDFRDIPLEATFTVYDREEQGITDEPGELVISPSLPGQRPRTLLPNEVNVIEWGTQSVLKADDPITVGTPAGALYGWANLTVRSDDDNDKEQAICSWNQPPGDPTDLDHVNDWQDCVSTDSPAALIGFVAWQRSFPDNAAASYGRIVEHAYGSSEQRMTAPSGNNL